MEVKVSIESDPKILAAAFWEMCNDQQAQFFADLHDIITKDHENNPSAYGLGELQWCDMSRQIEKNPKAKEMACAMMVWIFNHSTDFLSRSPQ